jgi:hypothetical protein
MGNCLPVIDSLNVKTLFDTPKLASSAPMVSNNARECQSWILWLLLARVALPLHATDVGGTITSNTAWILAGSPYAVTNNITVPTNVTLMIEPGVVVRLGSNLAIEAQAGGAIEVAGTAAQPVLFRSLDGTNNWRRIGADGAQARLTIRHADAEHGQVAVLNGASGLIEASYLHDYFVAVAPTLLNQPILVSDRALSLTLRACHCRNYRETLFRLGVIVVEDCLFEEVTGDAIDFDAARPGSVIRRCTMRHGTVINADAIDLGTQSSGVTVEDCVMYDFPFDKGVSIGEASTNITVRGCVVYAVDTGVAVKDSSVATIVNNTLVDSNYGLRLYEKTANQGGGAATVWNNVIWNNTTSITLANGSRITADYNDISGPGIYSGANNINTNPFFLKPVLHDYRLATNSPVLGAGTDGMSMGALFPAGSFLVDTDADALPDTWEMTFGLDFNDPADASADPDGDGSSNLAEYLAGTNPRIAASVLKLGITVNSVGARALKFIAAANRLYRLEFRDSFATGVWQKLTEIDAAPSERALELPITAGESSRFFRIVLSP